MALVALAVSTAPTRIPCVLEEDDLFSCDRTEPVPTLNRGNTMCRALAALFG